MSLRVAVTSDLHGNLPEVEECELLLICGDIMPLNIQVDDEYSIEWLKGPFRDWCIDCKAKQVVFIAGNHDFSLYWHRKELDKYFLNSGKIVYLKDELFEYKGLRIYGTPWCHRFGNWAFMRDDGELTSKFDSIPQNIDILMTHDAPYGIHDVIIEDVPFKSNEHIGSALLRIALMDKSPKYHFSGHLHGTDHSVVQFNNTKSYSTSLVNERYEIAYPILYLNI